MDPSMQHVETLLASFKFTEAVPEQPKYRQLISRLRCSQSLWLDLCQVLTCLCDVRDILDCRSKQAAGRDWVWIIGIICCVDRGKQLIVCHVSIIEGVVRW